MIDNAVRAVPRIVKKLWTSENPIHVFKQRGGGTKVFVEREGGAASGMFQQFPTRLAVRFQVGLSESVNCLLGIADHHQALLRSDQEQFPENGPLHRIGVLKLVHHRAVIAGAQGVAECGGSGNCWTQLRLHPREHVIVVVNRSFLLVGI